jgi:hypothetical protein
MVGGGDKTEFGLGGGSGEVLRVAGVIERIRMLATTTRASSSDQLLCRSRQPLTISHIVITQLTNVRQFHFNPWMFKISMVQRTPKR